MSENDDNVSEMPADDAFDFTGVWAGLVFRRHFPGVDPVHHFHPHRDVRPFPKVS